MLFISSTTNGESLFRIRSILTSGRPFRRYSISLVLTIATSSLKRKYIFGKMITCPKKLEKIRETYQSSGNTKELTQNINVLMQLPEFVRTKRHSITYTAQRKGWSFPYKKRKRWAEEEDEFLKQRVGVYSVQQIMRMMRNRGYDRTIGSIARRINVLGYSYKKESYSLHDVQVSLGVNDRRVRQWIARGYLVAKKREPCLLSREENSPVWDIMPANLAAFIRSHPEELSGLKPDMPWLISLLSEFWGKRW